MISVQRNFETKKIKFFNKTVVSLQTSLEVVKESTEIETPDFQIGERIPVKQTSQKDTNGTNDVRIHIDYSLSTQNDSTNSCLTSKRSSRSICSLPNYSFCYTDKAYEGNEPIF